jgi:hypothetical protein
MGGPAFDPVAFDVQVSTLVNLTTEINLAGSDPNGDPLTYVIDSLPASGILSDPGAGTIESVPYELVGGGSAVSYTPPCGETPVAEFGFLVQDQTAESNLATVTVTVTTSGLVLLHDFPMTSDPGWSAEGDWAFGQPAGGGTHNGDPAVGHTGNNVCGYNLGGDYGEDLPAQYLTSPALDLSVASTVELRFWRWLGVEGHFDEASVQVSNDGMSWTTVWANGSSTITDTSWTEVVLDLSAVADNESTVFIRWGMGPTDGSVTYPGWNLDDIQIWAAVPAVPTDYNGDGHVNVEDYAIFNACLSGPSEAVEPGCECMDLDLDGDLDLFDFALFQEAFEG